VSAKRPRTSAPTAFPERNADNESGDGVNARQADNAPNNEKSANAAENDKRERRAAPENQGARNAATATATAVNAETAAASQRTSQPPRAAASVNGTTPLNTPAATANAGFKDRKRLKDSNSKIPVGTI
jgi:hypothetical protein